METLEFINRMVSCGDKAAAIVQMHGMAYQSVHAIQRGDCSRKCFRRALRLILCNPGLIYCEGYAKVLIPTLHAWCVDAEGRIHDPVWGNHGADYHGIAFNRDYVLGYHKSHETFDSLIDNWQEDWPLLSLPSEQWRHQINHCTV